MYKKDQKCIWILTTSSAKRSILVFWPHLRLVNDVMQFFDFFSPYMGYTLIQYCMIIRYRIISGMLNVLERGLMWLFLAKEKENTKCIYLYDQSSRYRLLLTYFTIFQLSMKSVEKLLFLTLEGKRVKHQNMENTVY